MSFNYNQFTKAELADFLNKYGNDFKYITKPYLVILEEKRDKLFIKMEKIFEENDVLIEGLRKALGEERIKLSIKLSENHLEWQRIYSQIDKIDNLIAGD